MRWKTRNGVPESPTRETFPHHQILKDPTDNFKELPRLNEGVLGSWSTALFSEIVPKEGMEDRMKFLHRLGASSKTRLQNDLMVLSDTDCKAPPPQFLIQ